MAESEFPETISNVITGATITRVDYEAGHNYLVLYLSNDLRLYVDAPTLYGNHPLLHDVPSATTPPSPLPDPPEHLRDAWDRYQHSGNVTQSELSALDEWREDCARDAGF